MPNLTSEIISNSFRELQVYITAELEKNDGLARFSCDEWEREEGGGGRTMIIGEGAKIIKGGVAFSKVEGEITVLMREQMGMKGDAFLATGVSIVIHSRHPLHPTMHMNVRYFETNLGEHWFGGGIDLTPIYVDPLLAKSFHQSLKTTCDQFRVEAYEAYKAWADEYFYLPHRKETRGVGGIFFDHLKPANGEDKQSIFQFCLDLGRLFPVLYAVQTSSEFPEPTDQQLTWQALRWSRYVEYNLLFDRGTRFGIISNGRTESILLSMPPMAHWKYNYLPEEGSLELQTLQSLKKGIDWV
jgi:coproporphyrinogen III oxidase